MKIYAYIRFRLLGFRRITSKDIEIIKQFLGRPPRGALYMCATYKGSPSVIATSPLVDNKPFPTFYYLVHPEIIKKVSSLEASGYMKELNEILNSSPKLQKQYKKAHKSYIKDRSLAGSVKEISDISAGGMPFRIKCLHALAAHSLARPKKNPIGEIVLQKIDMCR